MVEVIRKPSSGIESCRFWVKRETANATLNLSAFKKQGYPLRVAQRKPKNIHLDSNMASGSVVII